MSRLPRIVVLTVLALVGQASFTAASGAQEWTSPPVPESIETRAQCARDALAEAEGDLVGPIADKAESLQAKYGGVAGFLGVVHIDTEFWLVVDRRFLTTWTESAPEEGRVIPSCVDLHALETAHKVISGLKHGPGEFSSVAWRADIDAIEIITTEDADSLRIAIATRLRQAAATSEQGELGPLDLVVRQTGPVPTTRAGRGDDTSPFKGGARIRPPGTGNCSTGFYINSSVYGTVMVTAGHCTGSGQVFRNGTNALVVGTVEGRFFPDPDLALIDGQNYSPRSFALADNTTLKFISEAQSPTTGVLYCNMGYVSRRVCSSYTALAAQYCDSFGCTTNLAFTSRPCSQGELSQAGDSGGGVYRELATGKLGARGTVVASPTLGPGTTCTRYDHKWSTISTRYSATIVTG